MLKRRTHQLVKKGHNTTKSDKKEELTDNFLSKIGTLSSIISSIVICLSLVRHVLACSIFCHILFNNHISVFWYYFLYDLDWYFGMIFCLCVYFSVLFCISMKCMEWSNLLKRKKKILSDLLWYTFLVISIITFKFRYTI